MPVESKPLFRPEAVRPKVRTFELPAQAEQSKIVKWAKMFADNPRTKLKETEIRDEFLYDIFRDVLGYVTVSENPNAYSFKKEQLVQVDGTYADAGFGLFGTEPETPVMVLEGKGPKDPLDRPYAGRKRSAFEQSLLYALNLKLDWYLVTNVKETRLYSKQADQFTYERFETAKLATDVNEWKRFVYLLGAERVLAPAGNHLTTLLAESAKIGRELTNEFYQEYRQLREHSFQALREANPTRDPSAILTATQKMLDRILFIAFCEDRGLLPSDSIENAYRQSDPYYPRPVWDYFKVLFHSVNGGNPLLGISQYNGGLFAEDKFLDSMTVPDSVCDGFKKLSEYEYGNAADTEAKLIDVEILGHVFEQSISDIEEMQNAISGRGVATKTKDQKRTARKEAGAFYTPAFITRYIVRETLLPVLEARFEALRLKQQAKLKGVAKKPLNSPRLINLEELGEKSKETLIKFWDAWLSELATIRIVDPSCGSGAFLIEAFDQMFAEYQKAESYLKALGAASNLFETQKTILEKNLFGMDLNSEAVQIAKLSSWIKTAEIGKTLTTLDKNIVQGNSVVAQPSPLSAWQALFADVFTDGGFDVVIGNPPYVRQEWISEYKPYLEKHYAAYDGTADLYVYFYELGLRLLKPTGRLGYIVTNKWLKAGYGEALRKHYAERAWIEQIVDFGHAKQIFPDADVFPCILVVQKPDTTTPPTDARVCVIPREQLRVHDLSQQIAEEGFRIPHARFTADAWNLEPPAVAALMAKIKANGIPLKDYAGCSPLYGIKTGFNEAFLIDTATKDRLVSEDPASAPLFKKYLRGQDIDRWQSEWAGLWMIAMKSSSNHEWPWSKAGVEAENVFQQTYPALHRHMKQYETELNKRQDKGMFWWELRACIYWQEFEKPKIVYQDLMTYSCFAYDISHYYVNNTVYLIPVKSSWEISVLNSPLGWYFAFSKAQHAIGDTLRMFSTFIETYPVAEPSNKQIELNELEVASLLRVSAKKNDIRRDLLHWLRSEFGIDKPSNKLSALGELSADEFIAEVKKLRGKGQGLTVADVKRLREEHTNSVLPLVTLANEMLVHERRISDLVNEAYGLTPEEVKLMWQTAPPRMPIPAPKA